VAVAELAGNVSGMAVAVAVVVAFFLADIDNMAVAVALTVASLFLTDIGISI
jgi:hypothetical protein